MQTWSKKEYKVMLDPFMGSGTALIEAQKLGLNTIGIDLNPYAVLLSEVKTHDYSETDWDAVITRIFNKLNEKEYSVPIVTDIFKDFQNTWGKGYNGTVIFVKSQSGVPIGTFYGKNVSVHKSKIKNATNFVVDNHRLFCYRCEYTTYSLSALKKMSR